MAMLLSLFTLLIANFTFAADDCSPVRMDQPGQAFAKIPVYDQSAGATVWDADICYAIVAAELRDAARFAQGDPLDQISAPLSIALNHKSRVRASGLDHRGYDTEAENENMLGPGSPRAAIITNNDQPVCDLKKLEQFVAMTDGAAAAGRPGVSDFLFDVSQAVDRQRMPAKEREDIERLESSFASICRPSSVRNLGFIIETIDRSLPNLKRFVGEGLAFVDRACEGHAFRSKVGSPALILIDRPAQMRPGLDRQLDRNIPVGIAYCQEILGSAGKCPASHTSVVIGRRRVAGTCQYLVRDSYGAKCKTRFTCEPDGSIWVPAADLAQTASALFYIPPGTVPKRDDVRPPNSSRKETP